MQTDTLRQDTSRASRSRYEIRELHEEDLEVLSLFGKDFYREANFPGEFKGDVFVNNWRVILASGLGKIIGLYEGEKLIGTLGCMVTPDINTGDLVCTETFWYVDRKHRGAGIKLFTIFEEWAWRQGVKRINVAHPSTPELEKLSGFYRKKGYRAVEVHYTKEA